MDFPFSVMAFDEISSESSVSRFPAEPCTNTPKARALCFPMAVASARVTVSGTVVPPMPLGSLFLTGKVGYGEYKKIIRFFAYPHAASPGHGGKIRPAPGRCMPGALPKACPAHSAQRGNRRAGRAGGGLCAALGLWYEAGRAYPCSTFFTLKRPARAFCRWPAAGTEGAPVYAGP